LKRILFSRPRELSIDPLNFHGNGKTLNLAPSNDETIRQSKLNGPRTRQEGASQADQSLLAGLRTGRQQVP